MYPAHRHRTHVVSGDWNFPLPTASLEPRVVLRVPAFVPGDPFSVSFLLNFFSSLGVLCPYPIISVIRLLYLASWDHPPPSTLRFFFFHASLLLTAGSIMLHTCATRFLRWCLMDGIYATQGTRTQYAVALQQHVLSSTLNKRSK